MRVWALILVILVFADPAHAFSSCTLTTFSPGPATIPGEQSDPAVAGQNVYAGYSDTSGLVLQVSNDGGATWRAVALDPAGKLPRIVALGSQVYVAWFTHVADQWSVALARSSDAGTSFVTSNLGPTYVVPGQAPSDDEEIQLSAVAGHVALIYRSGSGTSMVVAASTDYGNTVTYTDLPSPKFPGEEVIEMSGRKIFVAWNDFGADGLLKIFGSFSVNAGQTFSPPVNMTADGIDEREPIIALAKKTGTLYMVWRASKTPYGLTVGFIRRSDDFGQTWSEPKLIDEEARRARQFSVFAVEQTVYVAYLRHRTPDNWWAYLRISRDGATTFETPIKLGDTGATGMLTNEDHAPRMWAGGDLFRIVHQVLGSMYIRSSVDRGIRWSKRLLGAGEEGMVARNSVMWLGTDASVQFAQCE